MYEECNNNNTSHTANMSREPVRLWLSGLPGTVSSSQVGQRFESFGKVESVELIPEKNGTMSASSPLQPCRGFAYVQLSPKDEASLRRCISMVSPIHWLLPVRTDLTSSAGFADVHGNGRRRQPGACCIM